MKKLVPVYIRIILSTIDKRVEVSTGNMNFEKEVLELIRRIGGNPAPALQEGIEN